MHVREASIALESAIATAGLIAESKLADTLVLSQLLIFLDDALTALSAVTSPQDEPSEAVQLPPPAPPIPIPHGGGRVPGLRIVDVEGE